MTHSHIFSLFTPLLNAFFSGSKKKKKYSSHSMPVRNSRRSQKTVNFAAAAISSEINIPNIRWRINKTKLKEK